MPLVKVGVPEAVAHRGQRDLGFDGERAMGVPQLNTQKLSPSASPAMSFKSPSLAPASSASLSPVP